MLLVKSSFISSPYQISLIHQEKIKSPFFPASLSPISSFASSLFFVFFSLLSSSSFLFKRSFFQMSLLAPVNQQKSFNQYTLSLLFVSLGWKVNIASEKRAGSLARWCRQSAGADADGWHRFLFSVKALIFLMYVLLFFS